MSSHDGDPETNFYTPIINSDADSDDNDDSDDDDSLPGSLVDSVDLKDMYSTHDADHNPVWQTPLPLQLSRIPQNSSETGNATDSIDYETRSIYFDAAILDASANSSKRLQIRLLQIAPDVYSRPIHCKLIRRPLWDAGDYCALSYSWGVGPPSSKIIVGSRHHPETSFCISLHLWNALNHVRQEQQLVNVWIDAICIDQQNILERCEQVQIMGQIFNQASEVRIWLGEEEKSTADTTLFLSLCQQPYPWWTRLWIVQECAYAKKCPVIMLGARLMEYEELVERWEAVSRMDSEAAAFGYVEVLQSNLQLLQTPLRIWKMQNDSNQHRLPLFQRLREMAGRQCSVPHDRIYALLSLIKVDEERQLRPDYRKPFPDLLLEVSEIMRKSPTWNEERDQDIFNLFDVQPFVSIALSGNRTSSEYANALRDAIRDSCPKIIQCLVGKLRLLNFGTNELEYTLQEASYEGHEEAVQILLHAGVEVNARGGLYSNALQAASEQGHEKVVKMLLDAGADVDAQGERYSNALQAASSQGHEKVVQILLNAGANLDEDFSITLQTASERGHDKVVQMLLSARPDVDAQGEYFSNALQAASLQGEEKVVEMLLDVADTDGYYGSMLQKASLQGDEMIVQMLLDAGANVNAQGGPYGNALQAASERGHEKVVQMVLDAGADVNAQKGPYSNALQAASAKGHERVVQMLLVTGADVNAQGGYFGNSLYAASLQGYKKVVQMLLNAGADVNAQGGYFGNALYAASLQGYEKVVLMLLNAGADVNAQGGYFRDALQAASLQDDEKVVQMLLNVGANVNA